MRPMTVLIGTDQAALAGDRVTVEGDWSKREMERENLGLRFPEGESGWCTRGDRPTSLQHCFRRGKAWGLLAQGGAGGDSLQWMHKAEGSLT